jgi:EAL domain-containing protein (putative c-di-GMP-specific phosphodiesterase class I)
MLFSEKEERSRQFTLALRAGLPVLILIFLVFTTVYTGELSLDSKSIYLLVALVFITIYFIYFLINLSVEESVIDRKTHAFNREAFLKKLNDYPPKSIMSIHVENLGSLCEHYGNDEVDNVLSTISQNIHYAFSSGSNTVLIGRNRGSEFLIALDNELPNTQELLEIFTDQYKTINAMDISYKFAIIKNTNNDFEKIIMQLQDIIATQVGEKSTAYDTEIKDAVQLFDTEKSVTDALDEKKLNLTFRPLLNTKNDIVDTYEITVKLASNNQDLLPRVFLPIVNRLGLGREYDFILSAHIIDLLQLVDKDISFTFNISPFSLRDADFQEKFFTYLEEKKVDPKRLVIQLYERKTHHDLSAYLQTLKKFRSHGIRICIDNFGSSNASMEYMKHFKFDMVQFDRDYVSKLNEETSQAMLGSLIKMAIDLNVLTIAKWVDDDAQKEKLRELGIDYIQGFGVSKPIDETQLIQRYN